MISAFGVDHGGVVSKKDKDRAGHYGQMAGTLGTLGATSGGLAAGSGIVGRMEGKGKDPMHFTSTGQGEKPMKAAVKARILAGNAKAHRWQSKTAGGLAAGSLALAGGYKLKQKRERELSKRDRRNAGDRASSAGLAAGTAATGAAGLGVGAKFAEQIGGQANIAGQDARSSHHLLAGHKLGAVDMDPKEVKWHKWNRKAGLKVAGIKGAGALAAGAAAATGGAALYEGARGARKRKP